MFAYDKLILGVNLKNLFRKTGRGAAKIWKNPPILRDGDFDEVLPAIVRRWNLYCSDEIDLCISNYDDMYLSSDEGLDDYLRVGRSAVKVIVEAMLLSGRCNFRSVLDLPCGGGRVTRHLTKFLPESELFVSDIDREKVDFVAGRFKAKEFAFHHDFVGGPGQKFDLIFCGSLLTHFDRPMFVRALNYFIEALNPSGLAVLTLHGRNCASHDLLQCQRTQTLRAEYLKRHRLRHTLLKLKYMTTFNQMSAINKKFTNYGFGYFACPLWSRMYGRSYGGSYTAPSWAINRIEARTDCRILGYKEISYGDYQDVMIVQKI